MFVNGQVDSFISVVIGSPLDLVVRAQQGKDKPVYFMPFADFGIAPMGQGLLAHERTIAEKPDMLRRFVRASAKALNEIVKPENTEEAVDIAMRLSGAREERRDSVKLQWLETTRRLSTKNTQGHPLGWMSDKDWAVSVDILVKTGQLEKPIPTTEPVHQRIRADEVMQTTAARSEVIGLEGVSLVYRSKNAEVHALDNISLAAAEPRVCRVAGAERLRQEHTAQADSRTDSAIERRDPGQRPADQRADAIHRHRLSEPAVDGVADGAGKRAAANRNPQPARRRLSGRGPRIDPARRPRRIRGRACRTNCPVACSSASACAARSFTIRTC